MEPVRVKNAVDTWTDQETPNKEIKQGARLRVRAGAGALRYSWIFFNPPWPVGSNIVSAKLRIWNGSNITTSTTLSVDRATQKWRVNKINHNNIPTVSGAAATLLKATAAVDTMWEIDVTALVQAAASSGNWYGFRVASNNTTGAWFHASESSTGAFRPQLVVEWAEIPEEPDLLSPAENRVVSLQRPVLTYDYNDVFGDDNLISHQIQFGTSQALLEAGTTTFDTLELATDSPQYDTTLVTPGGTWAGLATGANVWWRVRAKDSSGNWSVYSDPVQFQRLTKGTLTITSPTAGAIWEGSPTVTWTFTGRTQRAYQVAIATAADPGVWLWDSGKITSTALSETIPFGVIKDASIAYIVIVRVWDTEAREATPGDPVYAEAVTASSTVQYDAAVVGITALSMTSDPVLPIARLTWVRAAGAPNFYQIQRSSDGGVTWEYIAEEVGSDLSTGGTNYAYDDTTASMYQALQWRVMTVLAAGRQSVGSTISGQVRRIAPFLMDKDGGNAVCFLNPQRERKFSDIQEVHQTLDGKLVLVTQTVDGKRAGNVSGRFVNDTLTGVTADDMRKRFERLRKKSGQPMVVAVANESIEVAAYNFNYDVLTDASGITYHAEFDWVEL